MDQSWAVLSAAGVAVVGGGLVTALVLRRRRPSPEAQPVGSTVAEDVRLELGATRQRFSERIAEVFAVPGRSAQAIFADLEDALIALDVGPETAHALCEGVRRRVGDGTAREAIEVALREEIAAGAGAGVRPEPAGRPWVVVVVGVNGVGKTTTIGKLARWHKAAGRRVLLIAADTFRAAAGEQLSVWAERLGCEVVRQATGASPAAVVFDGLKAAVARGANVVLIDTAGRLHTRANLMEELRKLRRVIEREVAGAPHETLLVLDATTGQNAIAQARVFLEALAVTGLIVTKLDGTARGGALLAVRRELGIPLAFIGVGEAATDLQPFDPERYVAALFDLRGADESALTGSPSDN